MNTVVKLATGHVLQPGCRFTARYGRRFIQLTYRTSGHTRHGEVWLAGHDDDGWMHYVLSEHITRVQPTTWFEEHGRGADGFTPDRV